MAGFGRYDGEVQMYVQKVREPSMKKLRFLRWMAEENRIEHKIAGPSVGEFSDDKTEQKYPGWRQVYIRGNKLLRAAIEDVVPERFPFSGVSTVVNEKPDKNRLDLSKEEIVIKAASVRGHNMDKLKFMRWMVEQERLGNRVAGPSSGALTPEGASMIEPKAEQPINPRLEQDLRGGSETRKKVNPIPVVRSPKKNQDLGPYDANLQMFVRVGEALEPNQETLDFLRWLAEQGRLEHDIVGPASGEYAEPVVV